jgi:hypothetical protein
MHDLPPLPHVDFHEPTAPADELMDWAVAHRDIIGRIGPMLSKATAAQKARFEVLERPCVFFVKDAMHLTSIEDATAIAKDDPSFTIELPAGVRWDTIREAIQMQRGTYHVFAILRAFEKHGDDPAFRREVTPAAYRLAMAIAYCHSGGEIEIAVMK